MTMPLLFGFGIGLGAIALIWLIDMHRSRAVMPVVLMAIASFYVVFAVEAGTDIMRQLLIAAAFGLIAVLAFRLNLWIAVVGLALHGLYDVIAPTIDAPAPEWWAPLCLAFDGVFAGALAIWLWRRLVASAPAEKS